MCRNVSLPGLAPADGCQDILRVVNRRLHYAGAVGAVNQRACFGRLQGNVEHLSKAAGLLSTKDGLRDPPDAPGAMLLLWLSGPEHLSLFNYCKMRPFFWFFSVYFCGQTGWAALPEIGNKVSQRITKSAQIFPLEMLLNDERTRFPP